MARIKSYIDYFKHQCTVHPELRHAANNEVFELASIEESLGALRAKSKEKDYLFRLLYYTAQLDASSGSLKRMIQGGFIVYKFASKRTDTVDDLAAALDATEKIVEDFIAKMIHDSLSGHPLFERSFNSPNDIRTQTITNGMENGYIGTMVLFDFENLITNCLPDAVQAVAWMDEGTTPTT